MLVQVMEAGRELIDDCVQRGEDVVSDVVFAQVTLAKYMPQTDLGATVRSVSGDEIRDEHQFARIVSASHRK